MSCRLTDSVAETPKYSWEFFVFIQVLHKDVRQLCLKQGILEVKCVIEDARSKTNPDVCPKNTDSNFTPVFQQKLGNLRGGPFPWPFSCPGHDLR